MLFELSDQGRSIACAISLDALRDLNGMRGDRAAALLECFVAARGRIEAIARDKHRTRSAGVSGTLHIWSDDIDDPPAAGAPLSPCPGGIAKSPDTKENRHGQGSEAQQPRDQEAEGTEEAGGDHCLPVQPRATGKEATAPAQHRLILARTVSALRTRPA
ncbi:DUF1488 family protein [Siccirubricoccus deserti]